MSTVKGTVIDKANIGSSPYEQLGTAQAQKTTRFRVLGLGFRLSGLGFRA